MPDFPPGYDPQKDKIEIVSYDPAWPELFLKEKVLLEKNLNRFSGLMIEHFGSTSVPALAAKPIIDIMITVESRSLWPSLTERIKDVGYFCWGENTEGIVLVKGLPPFGEKRTHHVHIYEFQGPRWEKELAFRDYLRIHPEEGFRYENLKRKLAEKFVYNRDAYTDGKESYIKEILAKISLG
jgi:GrpB-like predicted nucleotidyltransferase (UPF0157 family)